jgi:hypothetical protein
MSLWSDSASGMQKVRQIIRQAKDRAPE